MLKIVDILFCHVEFIENIQHVKSNRESGGEEVAEIPGMDESSQWKASGEELKKSGMDEIGQWKASGEEFQGVRNSQCMQAIS